MLNKAGQVVSANPNSVNFAVIELATTSLANANANVKVNGVALDLFDASGGSAWPIVIPSYLYIDLAVSRSTCAVREATVGFWLWFLSSPVINGILNNNMAI